MGIVQLILKLRDKEVIQDFVVCRQLKHDVILGADFGKQNCAGVEWTTKRTRVLSLNGIQAVEVEANELGVPVTASFHVKVPPTTQWGISGKYPWGHNRHPHNFCKQPIPGKEF